MDAKPSSPGIRSSAAVAKGYTFSSNWEQSSPLTDLQQAAVLKFSEAVVERPYPANLAQVGGTAQEKDTDASACKSTSEIQTLETALENTNQFYKWFIDLQSAMELETVEKYQHYINSLVECLQTCDNIISKVDGTVDLFSELQMQYHALSTKTKTLHDACNKLLAEKQRLIEFADAIHDKLQYFDELENISYKFYSMNTNVRSGNFLELLGRLDECISYVESNQQYAESSVHLLKFRQLQYRALGMIRSHILAVLKGASVQVQAAAKNMAENKLSLSVEAEASIFYVRFKAAANELKPILEEIEKRSSRKDYIQILADCHKLYCEQRLALIKGIVHQRICEFAKAEPLPLLTRHGCSYLLQVCQLEHQLFVHFFPSSSKEISKFSLLIDPLSTYLYDILRPKLIHESDIDVLCELVNVLKVEFSEDQRNNRNESLAALLPTLQRILADVRERLTFRARRHIRDEVSNYIPSDEDLDYPSKLEGFGEAEHELNDLKSWYPTLEKTLSCLSKLYHSLEAAVFTGLAQEAVDVCSISLQKASKLIAKRTTTIDGQLFLIKHLLALREQIVPFDVDFSATYKELDFSHMLEHLRRILRGQASLFDWSRSTSLARTLSPRVLESQINAKKELEKILRVTCEEFIMSVTKMVVDPMLSFVAKITAVKVALNSENQHKNFDSITVKPLKDQAFATTEKVSELVHKVNTAIHLDLSSVAAKLKLYLHNPSTHTILFKPIKTSIVEAHIQVHSVVKSEYSVEEQHIINMISIEDLQRLLDSLL